MDLTRLKALRELAARQTITAAAEALFLTPSAVSQQITQLEEELGQMLTERHGRGVRLTQAGRVLVEHVDRILRALDEAKSDLAAMRDEIGGNVRVAAFASAAAALMPPVMLALRQGFPRLQLTLVELEPSQGLAAVNSWNADIAIVDDVSLRLASVEKTVEQTDLLDDGLYAILAPTHPLADRHSIALEELKDEQWALDSAGSFYGEFVLDLCRQAGFSPRINAECRGAEIIASMVQSDCSISVVPGLRLGQLPASLRPIRIVPQIQRRISLVHRRGDHKHPAIRAVIEEIRRIALSASAARAEETGMP